MRNVMGFAASFAVSLAILMLFSPMPVEAVTCYENGGGCPISHVACHYDTGTGNYWKQYEIFPGASVIGSELPGECEGNEELIIFCGIRNHYDAYGCNIDPYNSIKLGELLLGLPCNPE